MKVGIIGAGTMGSGIDRLSLRPKAMKYFFAISTKSSLQTARRKLQRALRRELQKAK